MVNELLSDIILCKCVVGDGVLSVRVCRGAGVIGDE